MTDLATSPGPRFGRTPHLVELIGEVTTLARRLRDADPDPVRAAAWRERAQLASLQLDGSPLTELPSSEALSSLGVPAIDDVPVPLPRSSSWYTSLDTLAETPDERLLALEARGVAAAFSADDLMASLRTDLKLGLAELHRRLTLGLLHPDLAGAPRTTEQAVHDATIGRLVYYTADPATIPAELDRLDAWMRTVGAVAHGLVTAGILHLEVLRIHPFEAANGRLARAAARLVLRDAGLDPHGLVAFEVALLSDRLGYHQEVARTQHRRDASIWLERWSESVARGLRDTCRDLGLVDTDLPPRCREFLAGLGQDSFTLVDYRAHVHGQAETAAHDLHRLLDAGRIDRIAGSRGLRFAVR